MRFALNHILAPGQSLPAFFAMARGLGCTEVEIRNDLSDAPIQNGIPAAEVARAAQAAGVEILTINALYPFNLWSPEMQTKTESLARYAAEAGAKALVMCPLNEGPRVDNQSLVTALAQIRPILRDHGLTGLVEALGFPRSSLRTKTEAVAAIRAVGGEDTYKLVHDTFHHTLAEETALYPDLTGLVHISGVVDPTLTLATMEDEHRVLIDAQDRLNNVGQIQNLIAAGYSGPFSFEPFSPAVQALPDPTAALSTSMAYLRQSL